MKKLILQLETRSLALFTAKQRFFLERIKNSINVFLNQRKIATVSRFNSKVFLQPTSIGGGNIEHYYHFIFELILPLSKRIDRSSADTVFILEKFGPLTDFLLRLYPGRVKIIDRYNHDSSKANPEDICKVNLIGMDPRVILLPHQELENFKSHICTTVNTNLEDKCNKILLIERLPPENYYITEARKKGGGTSRRSIVNHNEVIGLVQSLVKEPFEFRNLQLEKISLEEQISLFNNASVVIAQHGAALANCAWMRSGSIVIELNVRNGPNHFKIISRVRKLRYFRYETNSDHALIDIDDFASWLKNKEALNKYFK